MSRANTGSETAMAEMGDEEREELPEVNSQQPIVVGIGASAGGVRVLQHLFDALPEKTGAAFVVVLHLDPDTRSEMPKILAARTHMPVIQVGEPVALQADHVYLIPPDRRLHITNAEIATAEFDEPRGRRARSLSRRGRAARARASARRRGRRTPSSS